MDTIRWGYAQYPKFQSIFLSTQWHPWHENTPAGITQRGVNYCTIIHELCILLKIKKLDEYIPFGPFIVIGAFITMFVPYSIILNILLNIFTVGLYSKNRG